MLTGIDKEEEKLGEFMQGGIKIKTMLDYTGDIKRFQEYLAERGEEARVKNYLLDPKEGTQSGVYEQTSKRTSHLRNETLSR